MELLEVLKEIILDNQENEMFSGISRQKKIHNIAGKASILIGVRRCGKSTLLNQQVNEIRNNNKKEFILHLNFFDDRLTDLRNGNLNLILEAYYSLYPDNKGKQIFCFFDELQECNNWEPFVDRLLRQENAKIYITGSSAKLLSKEIATQMRGRSISIELFPFSFSEYLSFHAIEHKKLTTETRFRIQFLFNKYFETGGFPEVVNLDKAERIMVLQEYYKTILHRDIIERFDSLHPKATMQIAYRLISSVSSMYSLNRVTEYLKSLGYKVSKEFVSDCIEWLEDAFFLFSVKKYDVSISKQNLNAKKIYCVDHALVTSVTAKFSDNKGYLLENMVFNHLRRISDSIFYYKTNQGNEVDFIWFDENNEAHLVQVAWDISDEKTKKREIKALNEAMHEMGLKTSTIVTNNYSESVTLGDNKIIIVEAWRYFMGAELVVTA